MTNKIWAIDWWDGTNWSSYDDLPASTPMQEIIETAQDAARFGGISRFYKTTAGYMADGATHVEHVFDWKRRKDSTMKMILHPHTREIMTEDMFLAYPDWPQVKFVELTDCQEIEESIRFVLTGKLYGVEIEAALSLEDYFAGKPFRLTMNQYLKVMNEVDE